MNDPFIIVLIVVALAARYGAQVYLSKLNRESAKQDVPDSLKAIFPPKVLAKSRLYGEVNGAFGRIDGAWSLGAMLIFWGLGGWRLVHGWAESIGSGPTSVGVAFFLICGALSWLAGLPLDLVKTFKIEGVFGFNRTTVGTYIRDQAMSLILGGVLGSLLAATVLWLFGRLGDWAWLAAWGAVVAWILILQAVAPAWLLPLFLKFTKLPDGDLRTAVVEYAARVKFPAAGIFEIDGSRRSSKANAVIAGWGPWRRIALFDTLTEKLSIDETVAVVAHEVGHWHHRHMRKRIVGSLIQMFVFFGVMGWVLQEPAVYRLMGVEASIAVGIVFFMIISGPVSDLLGPISNAVSRKHEFEADAYACETADGKALIGGLEKLGCDSLSNPTPHPWCVKAWYSHPPLAERIAALEAEASAN